MYPELTVGAVIFNKEDKLLLCKSHKWNNRYVIPGGHVELGEQLEEALRREIHEETGLEIYDLQLISIMEAINSETFHKKRHFIFIDFLCRSKSDRVTLNDEAQEFVWIDINEIENYDLGGFTKDLLMKIREADREHDTIGIFYNY
jgi:nucleoside triphosphatase